MSPMCLVPEDRVHDATMHISTATKAVRIRAVSAQSAYRDHARDPFLPTETFHREESSLIENAVSTLEYVGCLSVPAIPLRKVRMP